MHSTVMTKHHSSFIRNVDFNVDLQLLTIYFGRPEFGAAGYVDSCYIYEGVPFFLYGMMLHAESLGKFYNRMIKGNYVCRKVY